MEKIILSQYSLDDIAKKIADIIFSKINNQDNKNSDRLLTSKEVINMCAISHMTLFNWRTSNKLPFKKVGKKIFYSEKDVLTLTMPKK